MCLYEGIARCLAWLAHFLCISCMASARRAVKRPLIRSGNANVRHAYLQDLESGHDVVIAENIFLHEVELFPYACAARLANYVTYVVSSM